MGKDETAGRVRNILSKNRLPNYASILTLERDPRNTSERYKETDELSIIENMNELGWYITNYSQARSHKPHELKYKPYMASYENPELNSLTIKDGKIRIIQTGSKDGTTKLAFDLEFFNNSTRSALIPADDVSPQIAFKHIGEPIGSQVKDIVKSLLAHVQVVFDSIAKMKKITLNPIAQYEFAQNAAKIRFNDGRYIVEPRDLLTIRRASDTPNTLWSVFSRVQETLLKSPELFLTSVRTNKRRKAKALINVKSHLQINKDLWKLAEAYIK